MGQNARTLADELAWATASLEEMGIETARLDAELLLAHQLRVDRAALILRANEPITGDARTRYLALVARRASHEPVAYITGKRGFRHLELAVDPRALIPRPETEHLVEAALDELPRGARVVDVGTGSGAIALALAAERADLRVTGLERSAGALDLARHNAQRLRLEVDLRESDLLDDAEYDAVVANLPYVRDDEPLPLTVREYEPAAALFGGRDGLDVIGRLLDQVAERPAIRWIGLEVGADQGGVVMGLVRVAGFDRVALHQDLAGHDRIVVGRRHDPE